MLTEIIYYFMVNSLLLFVVFILTEYFCINSSLGGYSCFYIFFFVPDGGIMSAHHLVCQSDKAHSLLIACPCRQHLYHLNIIIRTRIRSQCQMLLIPHAAGSVRHQIICKLQISVFVIVLTKQPLPPAGTFICNPGFPMCKHNMYVKNTQQHFDDISLLSVLSWMVLNERGVYFSCYVGCFVYMGWFDFSCHVNSLTFEMTN